MLPWKTKILYPSKLATKKNLKHILNSKESTVLVCKKITYYKKHNAIRAKRDTTVLFFKNLHCLLYIALKQKIRLFFSMNILQLSFFSQKFENRK